MFEIFSFSEQFLRENAENSNWQVLPPRDQTQAFVFLLFPTIF